MIFYSEKVKAAQHHVVLFCPFFRSLQLLSGVVDSSIICRITMETHGTMYPIQAAMLLLQLSLGKLVLWYLQEKRMSRMMLGKLLPLPQILLVRASAPSFSEKKKKVSL
jgi:hypothetical protein